MEEKLTKQMKCAIGEQLVCAHLIAKGWPTVNVNSTIDNFKGIDLFCQNGIDSDEVVGIQVKTVFQGNNSAIHFGLNCGQAANLEEVRKKIKGPWIIAHVKDLETLDVDFYILTAKQMIDLVYGLHQWYLYGWERRPCTESLKGSVANIKLAHILGKQDKSSFSDTLFNNPLKDIVTLNQWSKIREK